jgi:hypothetical protein
MSRALWLLLLTCLGPVYAGSVMAPARLKDGPDSIESLLRLPEGLEPGRYIVQCETQVRTNGKARQFICYAQQEQWLPAVAPVAAAGRKARFIPATRDGAKIQVYMLIMVQIDITDRGPKVLTVPNNGADSARYGLFYTAPQRFNEFDWGGKSLCMVRAGSVLIWQKMHIDEQGNVSEYLLTDASNAAPWMISRLDAGVRRMEFMPGLFQGKPVPMFYIEPAFN